MEDYYPGEIGEIVGAWNEIHDPNRGDEETVNVDPIAFFGEGGEFVG